MYYTGRVIQRECLGRLAKWREKQPVKVVSGIRGCGKTTLLAMYIDWLKRTGVDDAQIVFVDMEEPESEELLNYRELYAYVKKRLCAGKFTYVFIDEAQRCEKYEKAIGGLFSKNQVDLYLTVSNTAALEVAASSLSPQVEIRMLPLSFAEYLVFSKAKVPGSAEELKTFSCSAEKDKLFQKTISHKDHLQKAFPTRPDRRLPRQKAQMEKYMQQEAFNNYLSFGGFPFTAALGGDAGLIRYCVDGIYSSALLKDVAGQAGINDVPLLEHVAKLMSQSTGRALSSKKLSAAIGAEGRRISANTVETYMRALSSAFVFHHVGRFDINTRKHLKTLGKYYITDTGIRNLLLESGSSDLDGQLENIVYLELLRRGFKVCIGKHGSEEVNFAVSWPSSAKGGESKNGAEENEGWAYFQVAASVREKSVLSGKLSPLRRIQDNYPKFILSLDETPFRTTHNGIIQRNLIDWLLDSKR